MMNRHESQEIVTEVFPELKKRFDIKAGVTRESTSPQQARVAFRRTMRVHGYQLGTSRTWLKPGFAAVIAP